MHASRSTSNRRGGATLAALVAVMLVFGLCMGILQVTNGVTNRLRASVDHKRAFHLAEAGLAEAYAGIAMAKTGNVGTPEAPAAIGGGMLWVEAEDLGDGLVSLASTAVHGRGRATLGLTVRRPQPVSSSLGLFSNRDLTIKGNTFLDSFNSLNGTYADHVAAGTNNGSIVGTNNNVTVHNGSSVMGDLFYGSDSSVDLKHGSHVDGAVGPRATSATLAPVEVPDVELSPPLEAERNETIVIPPGTVGYESITASRQGEMILTGPLTLVVEDFTIESHGSLTFDDSGGPIEVFVTGEFKLSAGSSATTVSGDPRRISIQVASDDDHAVTLGANAEFYGQIYAPLTSVKILPQFELFGSCVADELDITAQSRLHFDLATSETETQSPPEMFAWQVIDVPDSVASRTSNLYRHLEIDRGSLATPANSHADQELSVTYRDAGGISRTYTGSERAFDWTDVSELTTGTRDGVRFHVPGSSGSGD
ncbi:MAG: hypothetical protein WD226_07325 [Planctomycetota bacterium]